MSIPHSGPISNIPRDTMRVLSLNGSMTKDLDHSLVLLHWMWVRWLNSMTPSTKQVSFISSWLCHSTALASRWDSKPSVLQVWAHYAMPWLHGCCGGPPSTPALNGFFGDFSGKYGSNGVGQQLWPPLACYGFSCPWFWPNNPNLSPSWNNDNLFNFELLFLLHFHLQAKKGVLVNDRTHSATFLNAIHEPASSKVIITLNTCVNSYYANNDKNFLPAHLCIMGLASQLNAMTQIWAQVEVPHVRWVAKNVSGIWTVCSYTGIIHGGPTWGWRLWVSPHAQGEN